MSVPCLTAEQRLRWSGRPTGDPAALPDLMERLHFAVVERYTLGLVAALRTSARVSLDLFGRWPVMLFEREGDRVGPDGAVRRYRLAPSAVTRRVAEAGTFELGLAVEGAQTRAWVRVRDFPSLALSCPPPAPALYQDFHAHVSHAYLRALRGTLAPR